MTDAVHRLVHRALDLDGTCTGEHGVGIGKRGWFLPCFSSHLLNAYPNYRIPCGRTWTRNGRLDEKHKEGGRSFEFAKSGKGLSITCIVSPFVDVLSFSSFILTHLRNSNKFDSV